MLAIQAMTAKTTRRMQAVQVPDSNAHPAADTGNAGTASVHTNTTGGSTAVSIVVFGGVWTLTWDAWIWGIIFMVVGLVLCVLTLQWWKLIRLPLGGLIGFFAALAVMSYLVMPYVADRSAVGWTILWYCLVAIFCVMGVILFWKCPNLCVGVTCSWLLYMAGLQFVSLLDANMTHTMAPWLVLLIVIAFAAGGFFLGCYFPNFTIMIGTAFAGAYTAVVGLGLMTGGYPQPQAHAYVWWMYFIGQMVLSVAGLMYQWCVSYKKNHHRVKDDEQERLEHQEQVEVQAQVEIKL